MATSSVTIRVDSATKKKAASIADDFGFDLSSITRAFYKQIVRENKIPLNLQYPEPNSESIAAMKESEKILKNGKGYSSTEEMFEAMGV